MYKLNSFEIFNKVEGNVINLIKDNLSLVDSKKDKVIFREKEKFDGVYIGVAGKFSIEKVNYLGEKKVIFVLGQGDILNEFIKKDNESAISCISLTSSKYIYVSRKVMLEAFKLSNRLMLNFMEYEENKIHKMYRQLRNTMGSITGDKRLATKLWKLSKDYGKESDRGVIIEIPLTVTYMSELIGAKRETVSRQLKKLVENNLILQNGTKVTVLSREKLREYIFDYEK